MECSWADPLLGKSPAPRPAAQPAHEPHRPYGRGHANGVSGRLSRSTAGRLSRSTVQQMPDPPAEPVSTAHSMRSVAGSSVSARANRVRQAIRRGRWCTSSEKISSTVQSWSSATEARLESALRRLMEAWCSPWYSPTTRWARHTRSPSSRKLPISSRISSLTNGSGNPARRNINRDRVSIGDFTRGRTRARASANTFLPRGRTREERHQLRPTRVAGPGPELLAGRRRLELDTLLQRNGRLVEPPHDRVADDDQVIQVHGRVGSGRQLTEIAPGVGQPDHSYAVHGPDRPVLRAAATVAAEPAGLGQPGRSHDIEDLAVLKASREREVPELGGGHMAEGSVLRQADVERVDARKDRLGHLGDPHPTGRGVQGRAAQDCWRELPATDVLGRERLPEQGCGKWRDHHSTVPNCARRARPSSTGHVECAASTSFPRQTCAYCTLDVAR